MNTPQEDYFTAILRTRDYGELPIYLHKDETHTGRNLSTLTTLKEQIIDDVRIIEPTDRLLVQWRYQVAHGGCTLGFEEWKKTTGRIAPAPELGNDSEDHFAVLGSVEGEMEMVSYVGLTQEKAETQWEIDMRQRFPQVDPDRIFVTLTLASRAPIRILGDYT